MGKRRDTRPLQVCLCSRGPTYERWGDAADGAAAGADDLQRLVLRDLQQEQVAPSSADPESCSALHQQGFDSGPRGSRFCQQRRLAALPAFGAGVMSAGRGEVNMLWDPTVIGEKT